MKWKRIKIFLATFSIALLSIACARKYENNFPWGFLLLSEATADSTAAAATIDAYSDVILADSSLLAYWRLNESSNPVVDTKSGNDGSLTGAGTPSSQSGATADNDSDNGVCLNDTDTFRVVVPNNSALEFTAGNSITLEAWFKPTVLNSKMTILTQGRTTGTENSNYTIRINGAKVGFYFGDAGSANLAVYRTDDYILKPGNWYHIVVTHTYGSIADTAIYINGIERSGSWIVGAGTETPDVAGEDLWIGASDGPGAGAVNNVVGGCIDEVAIYDSILAISSVREHYRVAKNRFVKLLPETWVVGAGDSSFLNVYGGTSPYSYSIVSGSGTVSSTGSFTAPSAQGATVVRVTDADGNTDDVTITAYQEPDDIAGLQVWLKADSLGLADTANVTTWPDISGNGNSAAAVVAPAFAEAVLNGLPGVRFNGGPYSNLTTFTQDPSATSHTILAVFRTAGTGHETILTNINTPGTGRIQLGHRLECGPDAITTVLQGLVNCPPVGYTDTAWEAFTVRWDQPGMNIIQYSFGTNVQTSVGVTATAGGALWRIGTDKTLASPMNGDVTEVIIYNSALAAADRQVLECYLGEKYNLTIDSGHGCP